MTEVESFSIEAVIFVTILLVYVLTSHFIEIKQVPYIHESTVSILMGFLTAIFAKYTFGENLQFSGDIFFTLILPPIIFSAGYSLRKSLFFQNIGIISFLGVIGTVIAFVLLTVVLSFLNSIIFNGLLTTTEIMMLSSVLCATDTVAAMSLIKPEKYPVLNAVLFGEGIINDAVAIILFRTVIKINIDEGFKFSTVAEMFIDFLVLFVFSFGLGLIFGAALSYLLKIKQSFLRFPIKQTSLILLTGYLAYLIGEVVHLSGIISLFTCAVVMGHYSFMNISHEAQRGTGLAFETVAYVSEAFVFAYLGASILSINSQSIAVGMAFIILIFLPFIRMIVVYALPAIYMCIKKNFALKSKELKVCWYSGIVRGVIAFALCLQIKSENQDFIRTIVMIVVLVTTILGSSLLKTFAKCISLDETTQADEDKYNQMLDERISATESFSNYHSIGLGYQLESTPQGQKSSKKIEQFENKFVRPYFQKQKKLTYDLKTENINDKL